ncbi:MAG: IS1380 family transposase [Candidatus Scalindua sp.]|nr:IS1380 family transposase [Candidatus Scalindua sp.]
MITFDLSRSRENLTTHSGLALAGMALRPTELDRKVNKIQLPKIKGTPDISNSDVIRSYAGLLCQGKHAFEAIEDFRGGESFFGLALGVNRVPSCSTLRQRLDQLGEVEQSAALLTDIKEESTTMLAHHQVHLTPTLEEKIALDLDVSPFDNSNTKKEKVGRTYKGYDGYAPMIAYLGEEGYAINVELRPGVQHCQKETPLFLKESIRFARQITDKTLLVRMDSGNDAGDNLSILESEDNVDYLIKRNLRREKPETWWELAKEEGVRSKHRLGKIVYLGATTRSKILIINGEEVTRSLRCVYRVTERTITAKGQRLLVPEIDVETYWTSLDHEPSIIVEQYHRHGTSEQYHSEIKTDMGLERFPSGKFATNQLVLHCALLAYNCLRLIGQTANESSAIPLRKTVQRRRLKTVIQNLIHMASRLVYHARRYKLSFSKWSPWFGSFRYVYRKLQC